MHTNQQDIVNDLVKFPKEHQYNYFATYLLLGGYQDHCV